MQPVLMIIVFILLNGDIRLEHSVVTAFECIDRRQHNSQTTTLEELGSIGLQNRGIICTGLPENYSRGTPVS